MYLINRNVAIIRPRQEFLDWLEGVPDEEPLKISLDQLRTDCTTLLIPEFDDADEAIAYVYRYWQDLFEAELEGWYTDESIWPQERTIETFMGWFDIEIHSTVIEMDEDEEGDSPARH